MPLTEKLLQGCLAATAEIDETTDSTEEGTDKLHPETIAKLNAVAKKNGLASYDQYKQIGANAGLVMSGYDDVAKRYVGREALIKLSIARVKGDKKMSAEDKKESPTDLNDQLQFALLPLQYKDNINLVQILRQAPNCVARR
jgi:hypothetical protein